MDNEKYQKEIELLTKHKSILDVDTLKLAGLQKHDIYQISKD